MAGDKTFRPDNIVRQIFYEMINNKDHTIARSSFDPKLKLRFNQYQLSGVDEFLQLLTEFSALYSNYHTEILSIIAQGDTVVTLWKIVLKSDELTQIVSARGMTMFKFRAEKIIQINLHWDTSALD